MTRPEWVEAGALAVVEGRALYHPTGVVDGCRACNTARIRSECVIEAVEPLIRADERERNTPLDIEAFRVALTRNLRAQIAADIEAQAGDDNAYIYVADAARIARGGTP